MARETFDTSFQYDLARETWILYGVSIFLILLRLFARWRRVRSPFQFAADDWVMITAVPLLYTGLVACLNNAAAGSGSNLYPPEQWPRFTEEDVGGRTKRSRIIVVSEQCMLNLMWTLKACMLLTLARMTTGTIHTKLVHIAAACVIIGWVAVQIAFVSASQPFKGYWAMPPPSSHCSTLEQYAYVQAAFNISSDLLIIAVPLPLISSLKLPTKQKVGLGLLLSIGSFVITAAILANYYNLPEVYSTIHMFWYTREASIGIWIANLPGIWPLVREHLRFLHDRTESYTTDSNQPPQFACGLGYGNMSKGLRSHTQTGTLQNVSSTDDIETGLSSTKSVTRSLRIPENPGDIDGQVDGFPFSVSAVSSRVSADSDERTLNQSCSWKGIGTLEVQVDTSVIVQRDDWDGEEIGIFKVTTCVEGPEGEVGKAR